MPIYCYRRLHDGKRFEIAMSVSQMERRQEEDGTIRLSDGFLARRDYQSELGPRSGRHGWPIYSNAAGVGPHQITEARRHALEHGCPTDFTPDGRAILRDRRHRKKYLRSRGLFDRDAGWSDPD